MIFTRLDSESVLQRFFFLRVSFSRGAVIKTAVLFSCIDLKTHSQKSEAAGVFLISVRSRCLKVQAAAMLGGTFYKMDQRVQLEASDAEEELNKNRCSRCLNSK